MWRNSIRGDQFSDTALKFIYDQRSLPKPPIEIDYVDVCCSYSEFNWENLVNYHSDKFSEYLQDKYGDGHTYNLQFIIDIDLEDREEIISQLNLSDLIGYDSEEDVYVVMN